MKWSEYPKTEQPEHRIREIGPQALSNIELLSVALRVNDVETAQAIAKEYAEAGALNRIRREKILAIKGMGEGYANSITATAELVRRESVRNSEERLQIRNPASAAALVQYEMEALEQEQLRIILLDVRNRVMRIVTLYQGCANASNARTAEVLRDAIRENATGIIVIHNHPSGDPTPSPEDIALTHAIAEAGKLMNIEVLDHLVIGKGRFVSMKERGLGFK